MTLYNGPKHVISNNATRHILTFRTEYPLTERTFAIQAEARKFVKEANIKDDTLKILPQKDGDALPLNSADELPKKEKEWEKYFKYDRTAPPNTGIKHILVFRLETKFKYHELKGALFDTYLRPNRIWTRPHFWKQTRVKSIGFSHLLHPRVMCFEQETERLHSILTTLKKDKNMKGNAPSYELVRTIKKFGNQERIESALVYIHCQPDDVDELLGLLSSPEYKNHIKFEHEFIPEGILQNTNETTFRNMLKAQNHYISSITTIPIINLSIEAVIDLCDPKTADDLERLFANGINNEFKDHKVTLHKTNRSKTEGRWLIATPNTMVDQVRANIDKVIANIPNMRSFSGNKMGDACYMEEGKPTRTDIRKPANTILGNHYNAIAQKHSNPQSDDINDAVNNTVKRRRVHAATFAETASAAHSISQITDGASTITTTMTNAALPPKPGPSMEELKNEMKKMMQTELTTKQTTTLNDEIKQVVHNAVKTEMGKIEATHKKMLKETQYSMQQEAAAMKRDQRKSLREMMETLRRHNQEKCGQLHAEIEEKAQLRQLQKKQQEDEIQLLMDRVQSLEEERTDGQTTRRKKSRHGDNTQDDDDMHDNTADHPHNSNE